MTNDYLINKTIVYNSAEGVIFKLNKPDVKIKLSKPGAECLRILIDAQHQIISQDALVKDIWGQKGIVVGPNTLYQHIYMLRKNFGALGIDREIIKTTPQLGFNISTNFAIERIADEFQCTENRASTHEQVSNNLMRLSGNTNIPTQVESSSGWHKLFYFMPFIISLIILLVNSDRQPLNNDSFSYQDGSCTLNSSSDNLSWTYINSKAHSREPACQSPSKHIVNGLADDTKCLVGKQGHLVGQRDTTLLYCTRI
ncbi:TPA: winged helix-turn-helix domain-containing protein [Serratia fonticola]|uniref:Transcriptional regulatory protein, C terminal n=1 Tax=Serratia fonticola TaxID=47917 RepID=A0A3S4Z274_SERFO|nr:Transcriptional regulatory protein, C terminal [Serratia fonticola]